MNDRASAPAWAPTDDQLAQFQFSPVRLLHANPSKRSVVFAGRWRDTPAVCKWVDAGAPQGSFTALEHERRHYEAGRFGAAAELLDAGPGYLILSEVRGRSLRSVLEVAAQTGDVEGFVEATAAAFAMLSAVYPPLGLDTGEPEDPRAFEAAGERLYRDLLRSGPLGTRRGRATRLVGRMLDLACRPGTRRLLRRLGPGTGLTQPAWAHGDLHLDNLNLDPSGKVGVIDFGTSDDRGFPALDITYAAVTMAAYAAADPRIEAAFRLLVDRMVDGLAPRPRALGDLVWHYTAIAQTNPRFAPGLGRRSLLRARLRCLVRCAILPLLPVAVHPGR